MSTGEEELKIVSWEDQVKNTEDTRVLSGNLNMIFLCMTRFQVLCIKNVKGYYLIHCRGIQK